MMDLPADYSRPFWIDGPVGNNAFSYDRRGAAPRIRVPSLVDGTFDDVVPGDDIAFEEVDEDGVLHSCTGLAHLVRTSWRGVPTVVVDNHNHVFYFWFEALHEGRLDRGATLVHLDQHRDTRMPERWLDDAASLRDVFRYTNVELNVGNYIEPARRAGLLDDMLLVTGADGLVDTSRAGRANTIVNIDLDFFAPEMAYVPFDLTRRFLAAHLPAASLITIATSPFFIDQPRAIAALHRLLDDQGGDPSPVNPARETAPRSRPRW